VDACLRFGDGTVVDLHLGGLAKDEDAHSNVRASGDADALGDGARLRA
jgi:hypothetical protein